MHKPSRREFLKTSLLGLGAVSISLRAFAVNQAASGQRAQTELMGPLFPVMDDTTGIPLLMLPEGFRYRTMSWAGSSMSDGRKVPKNIDGMGVVRQDGSLITLVRNHEINSSSGAIGPAKSSYDNTGGGTTTLTYDVQKEQVVDSWVSLSGTLRNCAGGVTPWGTWLSCEEIVHSPSVRRLPMTTRQFSEDSGNARKAHGFVFEVPATGVAPAEPILAMGQFCHEAVAVDPTSGTAYMTEDWAPIAGFYRYVPDSPGKLSLGGRLQMMKVADSLDMRDGVKLAQIMPVTWVDIDEPQRGMGKSKDDWDGVVLQGLQAGGSSFIGLEGCTWHDDRIFFTSKLGGAASAGYIFEYDPKLEVVRLIYESPAHDQISGPDNIVMSPRGSLVVCEDRVNLQRSGQSLQGLTAAGQMFKFCQVNPGIDARLGRHDLTRTARLSEWAGVTFSPDGQWLFCNLYSPGITIAITGPWQDGLI